jgi:hypothetical protein
MHIYIFMYIHRFLYNNKNDEGVALLHPIGKTVKLFLSVIFVCFFLLAEHLFMGLLAHLYVFEEKSIQTFCPLLNRTICLFIIEL